MTTYASPRLTRTTLLVTISLIFFAGCYMLLIGIFHTINYVSTQKQNNDNTNITIDGEMMTFDEIRFPNCASPSVEIIFGAITFGHSMFGIVAITKEQSNLLNTYGHMLIMSCCIKFLFIVASVGMHQVTPRRHFMTSVTALGMISSTIELILIMCICQFTKLVKRGDAARQEIQSIHSYYVERRSRSRSQSRGRSLYSHNSHIYGSPTPKRSVSRAESYQEMSIATESASYYVPPPIYLKLDR